MSKTNLYVLSVLLVFACLGLIWWGAIPQDPAYHNFADQRSFWGIPNFWDVMSNIPMFFIGIWSFYISLRNFSSRPNFMTQWLPIVLSIGIFGASFGSAYYHWSPDNMSLLWDRLPMTLMFMPIFAMIIYDFVGKYWGNLSFYILVPLGIFSVFYWQYTESIGQGDLRFYAFVQFAPMILGPIILWLSPKKVPYLNYILLILAWYTVAKLSEHYDDEIFATLGFWSGHTIKHFIGGLSLFYVVKLVIAWEKELLAEVNKL